MSSAFEQIPHTTRGHFLLFFYATVDHLLHHIERLSEFGGATLTETFAEYPFLAGYDREIRRFVSQAVPRESFGTWWAEQISDWETTACDQFPLRRLSAHTDIGYTSLLAWLAAGLVDEDSRFGTVLSRLQRPLPHRRPCLETLGQMLGGEASLVGVDGWALCRPLLAAGMAEVTNPDAPRSEWLLRVPAPLWDAARGQPAAEPAAGFRYHPADRFPKLRDLIFLESFLEQLEQVPCLLQTGQAQAIILRGTPGSERLDVAGAIAAATGRGVIEWQPPDSAEHGEPITSPPPLLGPLCTLMGCLPVFVRNLGPGETGELRSLPGYDGPMVILLGTEGGMSGPLTEKSLTLTIPAPGLEQRLCHWQHALAGHAVDDLPAIAERFQLPGGYIRQVGHLASAQAALCRHARVGVEDVRAACRMLNRQLLDSLATHLDEKGSWQQLVVSELTLHKLIELECRCRHRERLRDHLGPAFGATPCRGVRALLTGSSGTGKTLAARILAAELGLDLYRVDLSAVVNKYIGETEKNLHQVLSRAEELDVILLLDEGDALLGNRTDVKSSNDRYANLETNFLLQRLENYQGIIVVTTNASQYIDSAFQRRMDVVVHFVPPGIEERWAIWQLHLPPENCVAADYLNEIAVRCELTGGQIRNAALHATLLAVDDGSRQMTRWHVQEALQSEYRKAGALNPLNDSAPNHQHRRDSNGGVNAFFDALSDRRVT